MRFPIVVLCGFAVQAYGFQSLGASKHLDHRKEATAAAAATSASSPTGSSSHWRHGESSPIGSQRQGRTGLFASTSGSSSASNNRRRRLSKDVVIIGGGLAGLSAALYLSQIDPERHITILDKDDVLKTPTGSFAAAGMLAPQSERLPKGQLLDLCLASKRMFPEFAEMVECMAQDAGEEGAPYLVNDDADSGLEPWNIGYVASGGFLAPAFAGDNVATWAPPEDTKGTATWLDSTQVRELEPNLHPDVVGGWWFPEDSSVDARRLTCSLKAACVGAGVQHLCGKNYEVSSLDLEEGNCNGLWLKNGKYISTKSILVANGAWMRTLLPVPIEPHKGQSLSLRMPKDRPPILRRVLFAQDSYIVPKADGRIVIGATVEAGSFDPNVTPAGIMHILSYALQLLPGLADLPLEETWAGLRPTTPDKGPILGVTPWKNLFLAGGYWRNGVLLAPKTGELMASLIAGVELSESDQAYLDAFAWDRFTTPEGGAALAANARYAASMYPIHTRKSGVGVAASVGTELGSYSTARSAGDERRQDRESMADGDEAAFELAASMGKQDGSVFSFGDDNNKRATTSKISPAESEETAIPPAGLPQAYTTSSSSSKTRPYGGSPDAITVGYIEDDTSSSNGNSNSHKQNELQSMYESIRENKSKQPVELSEEDHGDDRPDPGFRIYHIDEVTGEHREVPPYTAPGAFLESLKERQPSAAASIPPQEINETSSSEFSPPEETFDGYTTILNAAANDENIQDTMRKARMQNRLDEDADQTELDDLFASEPQVSKRDHTPTTTSSDEDLSSVYRQIRQQKAATTNTERPEATPDDRPDPGFRIYHVDEVTGKSREIPPYTAPADFLESLHPQQQQRASSVPGATIGDASSTASLSTDDKYSETTYDGYQEIITANGASSRDDELEAMRKARKSNRAGREGIDESDLHL